MAELLANFHGAKTFNNLSCLVTNFSLKNALLNLNSDSETNQQDKNPLGAEYKEGRVCFRTTSPDRVPIIGRISENSKIHLSLGHGSRGMVSTFLAAEIIAAEILNTTSPVEADLLKELSPVRFKNREKKRGISIQEIYPASFIWRR